ncbi:unnamed protein product [Medioppia subpectinata]|uniref:Uncharacterized protein n=1 Tax=Medioppia subpectinata TaxID=1979941 RepID=A0A7R9KF27_9ACAR|nr:unnamed protein product [Medioppia subpectinata]CAG2102133.1 unnamed protein product [Medioppia subpectinata]
MALCPICGPKLSICCSLLSIWGIIMLVIMGGLLKMKSIAFAEDLLEEYTSAPLKDMDEFLKAADEKYENAAVSTWIAAAIYVATLAFSLFQAFLNKKADKL